MWLNPQFPADLVTFTEEILNGKLHFLCSVKVTIQPPTNPSPSDKTLLLLWKKHFLTEIYKNTKHLLSKCFKNAVLRCQEMVRCKYFFWHQTETCLLENLKIQKGDFLLENLKINKNSDNVHWNVWTNIKTSYARNNIFKKRIPNMIFWIIYTLVQISFVGTTLGRFSQFFFYFLSLANHSSQHFNTVPPPPPLPHHKKASYGPVTVCFLLLHTVSENYFIYSRVSRVTTS